MKLLKVFLMLAFIITKICLFGYYIVVITDKFRFELVLS